MFFNRAQAWLPGAGSAEIAGVEIPTTFLCSCSNTTASPYPCHYKLYCNICLSIALIYCSFCIPSYELRRELPLYVTPFFPCNLCIACGTEVIYVRGPKILFGATLKKSSKFSRPKHFVSKCYGKCFTNKYQFQDYSSDSSNFFA